MANTKPNALPFGKQFHKVEVVQQDEVIRLRNAYDQKLAGAGPNDFPTLKDSPRLTPESRELEEIKEKQRGSAHQRVWPNIKPAVPHASRR